MKRFTPLFLSLALLVAALGVYGFLSFGISRAVGAASEARAAAASSGARALFRQNIAGFLGMTEESRTALATFVPADKDVPALIQEIEDAAKREKVSVTISQVSVGTADWKYFEPLEIKLSARGSFTAVAAFATDLESLPHPSRLSSFAAQSASGGSWFATYAVDFVKQKTSP